MSIETRSPPPQYALRLKRALGGRAGWGGFALQILFVAALVWLGYEIVANARANLEAQRITSGFGFLRNNAGFDVSQSLVPYSGSDTYAWVFLVGLLNTLLVSIIGIVCATVIGFIVALGRLSPNLLLSRVAGAYVELIRNLPLLFQILFWYLAVLAALPGPRQSISLFSSFFLSNRGLVVPRPIAEPGLTPFLVASIVGILAAVALSHYARRQLFEKGRSIRIWPYVLALLIGLPGLAMLLFGAPVMFEVPELKGFNFAGGSRIIPELVALTVALSMYTAAFIAEVVRAGILSVHKGQMEAGMSLGLTRGTVLAPDRGAAGHARHSAAADQPVSQSDQKLVARGCHRLSGSGLGVRRNDAEPDRAGDRDHRDHDGCLSPALTRNQRNHEPLWVATRPESSNMSLRT